MLLVEVDGKPLPRVAMETRKWQQIVLWTVIPKVTVAAATAATSTVAVRLAEATERDLWRLRHVEQQATHHRLESRSQVSHL